MVYDENNDRDHAFENIKHAKTICGSEFLIVVISNDVTVSTNPTPNSEKTASADEGSCPTRTPYLAWWPPGVGFDQVQYHSIAWNKYLDLDIGVRFDYNEILSKLM